MATLISAQKRDVARARLRHIKPKEAAVGFPESRDVLDARKLIGSEVEPARIRTGRLPSKPGQFKL